MGRRLREGKLCARNLQNWIKRHRREEEGREREELEIGKISTQHKWENYVIFRKHKGSCELVRRRKTRERERAEGRFVLLLFHII